MTEATPAAPEGTEDVIAAARQARARGETQAAFRLLKDLVARRPADSVALGEYGGFCRALGLLDEARALFMRMLDLDPDNIAALNNLAVLEADCGDPAGADTLFRRALAIAPGNRDLHTNLLSNAQYVPGVTLQVLDALHRQWDARHAGAAILPSLPRPESIERPLRLGFVSADFCHHPIAAFVLPLFQSLDRTAFSVHCFAQGERSDHLSPRFKALASTWDRIDQLNDVDAARTVRARGVDILFDLAGHSANNRLGVFQLKPAPLQITWVGYLGTTGLRAIDYVLADDQVAPPGDDAFYTERLLRLPRPYVPYVPPPEAPPVSPPPFQKNGFVTLGGLHNPAKINADVLAGWAEILRRVPDARLFLKYRGMDATLNRRRVLAALAEAGIAEHRAAFAGPHPSPAYLQAYHHLDIALDPFPFTGGATTCEALWMGVPVVSLRGATFPGRHTAGYLTAVGLSAFIAETRADYIEKVVRLANDRPGIADLRATLRQRMTASPLLDHAGYARDFGAAMRRIWRDYCEGSMSAV